MQLESDTPKWIEETLRENADNCLRSAAELRSPEVAGINLNESLAVKLERHNEIMLKAADALASLQRELEEAKEAERHYRSVSENMRAAANEGAAVGYEAALSDAAGIADKAAGSINADMALAARTVAQAIRRLSRAVSGSELGGDHLEQGVAQPAAKAEE